MSSASLRRQLPTIRWDRLGRVALLCVLFGIFLLYLGPARSLVQALGQSKARQADVRALEAEHQRLEARRVALTKPGVIESEARRLGYVKPGERPYIVTDLPK